MFKASKTINTKGGIIKFDLNVSKLCSAVYFITTIWYRTYRLLCLNGLVSFKLDFDLRLGASGVVVDVSACCTGAGLGDFVFFDRRLLGRRFITFPPRTELDTASASDY